MAISLSVINILLESFIFLNRCYLLLIYQHIPKEIVHSDLFKRFAIFLSVIFIAKEGSIISIRRLLLFYMESQCQSIIDLSEIYFKLHLFGDLVFVSCYITLCVPAQLLQSCPTLCNTMDHNLPASSVLGIFFQQEYWAAMPFSGGSSQGSNPHLLHCKRMLYHWDIRKAHVTTVLVLNTQSSKYLQNLRTVPLC